LSTRAREYHIGSFDVIVKTGLAVRPNGEVQVICVCRRLPCPQWSLPQFAELRHAPSLVLVPLSYGFDNRRPSQRALASDARGRRSGRRPCVCLVLSSSAGARCAVVSSNATLFPPLEHSAGRTRVRRWRRRSGSARVVFRLICDKQRRLRPGDETTGAEDGGRSNGSAAREGTVAARTSAGVLLSSVAELVDVADSPTTPLCRQGTAEGRASPAPPPSVRHQGVIFETNASVLPNCAPQSVPGAGFAAVPCWNASTAGQPTPLRESV
jgi:hypothetical protein